jgi:hypothetical protein
MLDFLRTSALVLPIGLTLLCGCADAERIEPQAATTGGEHTVGFVGYAYDGVSGARLTDYSIDATVVAEPTVGNVAEDGRYDVGPLSAYDDFTIGIAASGYRVFFSHNAHIGLPPEFSQSEDIDIGSHQTRHFDAYLFPDSLEAPAVTFGITSAVMGASISGQIRLRAAGSSLLADGPGDIPGGVPGQVWSNDEDLQAGVINADFSNGTYAVNAGELVYGVTYQVDIYDVSGFQPFSGTYTAGVETNKSFTLTEEVAEPLVVTTSTALVCVPPTSATATSGAVVTIEFNHPIEYGSLMYPGGPQEALDDFISIVSPNANMDMVVNTLYADNSDNVQERAVSAIISGSSMQISWNPSVGLEMQDAADPITQVTYGGLGNVQLQRVGSPSSAKTLTTLLGVASITCD